jgi:hypothetical protein
MRALLVLLFLALLPAFALSSPFSTILPEHSLRSSPTCKSLKCILSSPKLYSLPTAETTVLSSSSLVDVLLHFREDSIINGRAAAEQIAGTTIDHFIAPRAYACTVSAASIAKLAASPLIEAVTHLLPEHKFLQSELRHHFKFSGDRKF